MTGLILAAIITILIITVTHVIPAYRKQRYISLTEQRMKNLHPPNMTEARRVLQQVYSESRHGTLFALLAESRLAGLSFPPESVPHVVASEGFTRSTVSSLHAYFAEDIRRGQRVPPLFYLPSPVFDGYTQPLLCDDSDILPVAVLNPLLVTSLTSYLSMYFVLIAPDVCEDFRALTMARFMSVTRTLLLADPEGVPKALNDIALYHCLHSDRHLAHTAAEEYGYCPSPDTGRLIFDAFRYITDFAAMHECAHHFLLHYLNANAETHLALPHPEVLVYRHATLESEADRTAAERMLAYRPASHDEYGVDPASFHFAIAFYLHLLEYIDFIARTFHVPSFRGSIPMQRYMNLRPLLTSRQWSSSSTGPDTASCATDQLLSVFSRHRQSLRAALSGSPAPVPADASGSAILSVSAA